MTEVPADHFTSSEPKRRIADWSDYLALMKPRVMSLAIFTAIVGYLCAPGEHNPVLAALSIFAIAMGAGAAGALNMWYDADIDGLMKRTRMRPVPAGIVHKDEALAMGIVMSFLSVLLLALTAKGYLAASLLAFTIFFYAVVYSMWLKRSTPQNIVIGGLAGALPPLVAWAAATGDMALDAWLLVGIIFLWTPPHSWALALYKAGDYASANIPMMPVAKGAASTRLQIFIYSIALVLVGVLPSYSGLGGQIYAWVSLSTGLVFLLLAWRVHRSRAGDQDGREEGRALYSDKQIDNRPARDLFAFSLLYLTALFAALLVEHGFHMHHSVLG
ncbi:heme o synthase [Candidatus Phycosocius spiralis]|uniref:Protoheme IX farnesyltransferase n=1 Tax=Candidatus Phycosocius spiralis TaxID=2815099 RepID=A0ABQ4PW00_9PROT|nr:heme o synthase [Candidatus Phycosocius spiralis]GIU67178.1 protoheme IX farnesyltransferase [Candidatus Phycosocius spiralis]